MSQGPVELYIALLVLCGLLSGSEAALLSIQRVKLHQMLERRVPGARRMARLVEDPQRFLPTILLANNLVNTAAAALGTAIALSFVSSQQQAVLVATVGITVLLLLFGETIPKTVGIRHAETFSLIVARPLGLLGRLLLPFTVLFNWLSRLVLSLLGGPLERNLVTEEELRVMISVGRASGAVDSLEANLLERVFRFGDRQVREVMTPRIDVVWVPQAATLEQFLALYGRQPHSRFPVATEGAENILGVINTRDVFRAMATNRLGPQDDVTALSRPPLFTPETKPVSELMQELQQSGQVMAVAVDEFGEIAGVATLTQLVEDVMGPLHEDVPSEEEFFALNDRTFLVDGGARVEDVNERLEVALPEGDYETLAGFLLNALGRIPSAGEEYRHEEVHLVVARMQGMKIERVRVTRPIPTPVDDQEREDE